MKRFMDILAGCGLCLVLYTIFGAYTAEQDDLGIEVGSAAECDCWTMYLGSTCHCDKHAPEHSCGCLKSDTASPSPAKCDCKSSDLCSCDPGKCKCPECDCYLEACDDSFPDVVHFEDHSMRYEDAYRIAIEEKRGMLVVLEGAYLTEKPMDPIVARLPEDPKKAKFYTDNYIGSPVFLKYKDGKLYPMEKEGFAKKKQKPKRKHRP